MKITITVRDGDQGMVHIDSNPPYAKLLRMHKDHAREDTKAVEYAIVAVGSMVKLSKEITQEKVKAQFDAGLIPAVQSTRQMFS